MLNSSRGDFAQTFRWGWCEYPDALNECFGCFYYDISLYITNDFTWATSVRNVAFPTVWSETNTSSSATWKDTVRFGKVCVCCLLKFDLSIMFGTNFMLKSGGWMVFVVVWAELFTLNSKKKKKKTCWLHWWCPFNDEVLLLLHTKNV